MTHKAILFAIGLRGFALRRHELYEPKTSLFRQSDRYDHYFIMCSSELQSKSMKVRVT